MEKKNILLKNFPSQKIFCTENKNYFFLGWKLPKTNYGVKTECPKKNQNGCHGGHLAFRILPKSNTNHPNAPLHLSVKFRDAISKTVPLNGCTSLVAIFCGKMENKNLWKNCLRQKLFCTEKKIS